jgi:SAM-dependent methyltransferase
MNSVSPLLATIWFVGFLLIVVMVFSARRKRKTGGSAAAGAVWDLLNEDKRKAVEIIVQQRAEARDPEDAEGNKPDLERGRRREPFAKLEFDGWQRVAGRYQDTWADLSGQFVPPLLDAARVSAGTRVIDVCCGPGVAAEAAAARGALTVGVDFSFEMTSIAKGRCPEVSLVTGDAAGLPFASGRFDAVVMNFGLLHLPDAATAFAESARVLRPGGRYAFTVWGTAKESGGAKILEDAFAAHADPTVRVPKGPDHLQHGRIDTWRSTLAAAGFQSASVDVVLARAEWELPTDFFLFEAQRHAGVRTAAFLAAQTPEALEAINQAITRGVRGYARGRDFVVPYAAWVVSAMRSGPGTPLG